MHLAFLALMCVRRSNVARGAAAIDYQVTLRHLADVLQWQSLQRQGPASPAAATVEVHDVPSAQDKVVIDAASKAENNALHDQVAAAADLERQPDVQAAPAAPSAPSTSPTATEDAPSALAGRPMLPPTPPAASSSSSQAAQPERKVCRLTRLPASLAGACPHLVNTPLLSPSSCTLADFDRTPRARVPDRPSDWVCCHGRLPYAGHSGRPDLPRMDRSDRLRGRGRQGGRVQQHHHPGKCREACQCTVQVRTQR